jgi:hypothetical protein
MLIARWIVAALAVPAALLFAPAAHAQKYRSSSNPYAAQDSYSTSRSFDPVHDRPRDPRFTEKEQRIIDRITRADQRNGR